MRSLPDDNVTPIRALSDDEALAWLAAQPDGKTTASQVELSKRWGWTESRTSRRLKAWKTDKIITRRGDTITAIPGATAPATLAARPPARKPATSPAREAARTVASPAASLAQADAVQVADATAEKSEIQCKESAQPPAPEIATDAPALAPDQAPGGKIVETWVCAYPNHLPRYARPTALPIDATLAARRLQAFATAKVYAFPAGKPQRRSARTGLDAMAILAIGGAGILACFSIILCVLGFATMFPAMPHLAMGMAAALESVRLIAIGFTGRCWREVGWLLRPALLVVIVAAETVSVVSVYSQLTTIHNGSRPVEAAKRDLDRATLQTRIERQQAIVDDLDRRLAQNDRMTAELVGDAGKRGKVNGAQGVMDRQGKERAAIVQERQVASDVLASLKTDTAAIAVKTVLAEAEVAGVKQLAALVGGALNDEAATRLWIAAITLLLGPFAAVLTAAAASRRRH